MVFSDHQRLRWKDGYVASAVESEDGAIFTVNRLDYPERVGKVKNLLKSTRKGELMWSIEPRIRQVPLHEYDYFTWVKVHDDAQNLVEAYTGSGYKLIVDAATGDIKTIEKDHVFRYLEIKDGTVIKDDQVPLDLKGKKAEEAIEVDDGIIVLINPVSYPELKDSRKLADEKFDAEAAGLPAPPIHPMFPGSLDNIWKVRSDGTLIRSLSPPPYPYPYLNMFSSLGAGKDTTEIGAIHKGPGKPNELFEIDVRDLKVLSARPYF
jgi:hypothetical protein